jgi:hypothetical protein
MDLSADAGLLQADGSLDLSPLLDPQTLRRHQGCHDDTPSEKHREQLLPQSRNLRTRPGESRDRRPEDPKSDHRQK